MSLYYGQSKNRGTVVVDQKRPTLSYWWTYRDIYKKNYTMWPKDVLYGYPFAFADVIDLNENSTITVLTHRFDRDSDMTDLTIRYVMYYYKKDGSSHGKDLFECDLINGGVKLATTDNIFRLHRTIKWSDITPDYKDVACFIILLNRLSDVHYSNESTLTVMVSA